MVCLRLFVCLFFFFFPTSLSIFSISVSLSVWFVVVVVVVVVYLLLFAVSLSRNNRMSLISVYSFRRRLTTSRTLSTLRKCPCFRQRFTVTETRRDPITPRSHNHRVANTFSRHVYDVIYFFFFFYLPTICKLCRMAAIFRFRLEVNWNSLLE